MSQGYAKREDYELAEKMEDGKTKKYRHEFDAKVGCAMGCSSDGSLTSEMTVRKMDGQENVALPVKFYSIEYHDDDLAWYDDGIGDGNFYTNLNFKYQIDSSFTISDYCTSTD